MSATDVAKTDFNFLYAAYSLLHKSPETARIDAAANKNGRRKCSTAATLQQPNKNSFILLEELQ
jgi:hypothetical protein